jgi:hypothetical protein
LIERAVGDLLGVDQIKLKGPNVFDGRPIERFFDKVGKPSHVVRVSVDGGVGEVANHHVFGKPLGDGATSFFVGRHRRFSIVKSEN